MKFYNILIAITFVIILCTIQTSSLTLKDGIIAYYSFDQSSGNLTDVIYGTHNITNYQNNINFSVAGIYNTAGNFSGTNFNNWNYNTTNPKDFNPNNTGSYTINIWVNPKSNTFTLYPAYKIGSSEYGGIVVTNDDVFYDMLCDIETPTSKRLTLNFPSQLPKNAWNMYSLVLNGTDMIAYMNGTKISSVGCVGTANWTEGFAIGYNNVANQGQFEDEYGFWNRSLTQTEISYLYNFGNSRDWRLLGVNNGGFVEDSQTYNQNTLVGSVENFSINITYDSSLYSASAIFIYNGVSYPAVVSGTGNTASATSSISVPTVVGVYNFSWNISLSGTQYSSTIKNQTVNTIGIDDCSVNKFVIYNFTMRDEETRSIFNGTGNLTVANVEILLKGMDIGNTIMNFSKKFSLINPFAICSNTTFNQSMYRVDLTLDYSASGYVQKYYFIDNGLLSNVTLSNNLSLHDLLTADSTTFLFQFSDASGLKVPNGIVHVYRDYINDGVFREVERAKMDNNGETHVHLVEEDVIYYFTITLNGDDNIIYTSDNYNAKCLSTPCTISLSATGIVTPYPVTPTGADVGVDWNIVANATSRTITLTYQSNTTATNMSIYVYKYSNSGNTFINSSSASGLSGVITINVPVAYGNAIYIVQVFNNDIYIKPVWIDWQEKSQDYFGVMGAILGGLVVLCLALISVTEGLPMIIIVCVAIIVIWIMQLVDLTWMAVISILCAGGIIAWRIWLRR